MITAKMIPTLEQKVLIERVLIQAFYVIVPVLPLPQLVAQGRCLLASLAYPILKDTRVGWRAFHDHLKTRDYISGIPRQPTI